MEQLDDKCLLQQKKSRVVGSLLDDFLENSEAYNAASVAEFIVRSVQQASNLTGGKPIVHISEVDTSKSLKEVLTWCIENPQPVDKLSKAVDLMISGWVRAKFMDLIDNSNNQTNHN